MRTRPTAPPAEGRFVAVALGTYVILGVVGGLLWRWWWNAPSGVVINHGWIPGVVSTGGSLYPLASPPQAIPAATAHWALLAVAVGLIGGLVGALAGRGREYAALAVTMIGSGVAALLMMGVGYLHRGVDPNTLAAVLPDGVILQDRLSLATPWLLALPLAVSGTVLAVAFIGWSARTSPETHGDVPEGL